MEDIFRKSFDKADLNNIKVLTPHDIIQQSILDKKLSSGKKL